MRRIRQSPALAVRANLPKFMPAFLVAPVGEALGLGASRQSVHPGF
jgi:hypothetical protein